MEEKTIAINHIIKEEFANTFKQSNDEVKNNEKKFTITKEQINPTEAGLFYQDPCYGITVTVNNDEHCNMNKTNKNTTKINKDNCPHVLLMMET